MDSTPLIGITSSWAPFERNRPVLPDGSFDYLKNEYSDSIARAGGASVIIPNFEKDGWGLLDHLINRLDGLLLSGGSDLAPDFFGENEISEAGCFIRRRRDELELELLRRWDSIRPDRPILAICRGHQVLNVYYGGTLIQDFAACGKATIPENHRTPDGHRTYHEIEVLGGTLLAEITGEGTIKVNSSHHQGTDRLGEGFIVSARAADGIIEAIELKEPKRWLLSVQWHPEALNDEASDRIFEAFVEACRK